MDQKEILEFLTKTVQNAYLQIKNKEPDILTKSIKDLVTNCDYLVESYIINEMNAKYPNIDIISEEFNSGQEKTSAYFVIDPIDGTKNFANDLDIWAIQVAYTENEKTLASCLYFPKLDLLFTALHNEGSYKNNKPIMVKPYQGLNNSLVAFDFAKPNPKNYDLIKEVSKEVLRSRQFGAASYGFSMVANGSLDGYCILQNTPWDIEPGLLACIEAKALVYSDNFCTIVANDEEIIELILKSIQIVYNNNPEY